MKSLLFFFLGCLVLSSCTIKEELVLGSVHAKVRTDTLETQKELTPTIEVPLSPASSQPTAHAGPHSAQTATR